MGYSGIQIESGNKLPEGMHATNQRFLYLLACVHMHQKQRDGAKARVTPDKKEASWFLVLNV